MATLEALRDLFLRDLEEFESFDILVFIQGISSRLAKIQSASMHFSHDLESDNAFIKGKLFLLQQVLFEVPTLLGLEEGSDLHCRLSRHELKDSFFKSRKSSLKEGDYYFLSFSRNDADLDHDELICLTEKLIMKNNVTLSDHLIFSYGIVLEHGGDLFTLKDSDDLESLCLLIPTVQNQAGMYEEKGIDENDLRGNETILLVDDEAIIWDVVIDMLQSLGYMVILAENGKDCVEIYRENPGEINLVLLDMLMPEMNGHDAFFALKEIDKDVNVLLQSGYIAQEEAQDVLDAGARGFLQKPYRMTELAKKIREILD